MTLAIRSSGRVCGELISPDDVRWLRVLSSVKHDIYQTPGYVRVAAAHDGGVAAAYYGSQGQDELLIPLVLRNIPGGGASQDAVSPYGYGGILSSGGESFTAEALNGFVKVARSHGLVSAFLRFHPLIGPSAEDLLAHGKIVRRGQTVYIDLAGSEQNIAAGFRKGHRHNLNRLSSTGFHAHMDRWEWYGPFMALYSQEMRRLKADAMYRFQPAYFENLRNTPGPALHFGVVLSPDSELAAAGLFTVCGDIMQYHLSASEPESRALAPIKLLIAQAAEWGRARGCRLLHLGGGRGGSADTLFAFKAGFSASRGTYHTCDLVLDDERYESLCRPLLPTGPFFPAYRAQ
jgi:hypothetical protein